MEDVIVEKFITLFRGRGDCYGSEEGGCVRLPLDRGAFLGHLDGHTPIGVYPSVPRTNGEPFCVWGCSDIDIESLDDARLIQRTLAEVEIVSWVERSRSKGYHVWVFAEEPVTSKVMRNALLMAHKVANYPAREVNPKQTDVSATKVGNYVRLPYVGGLQVTPTRRVILDERDEPMHIGLFVTKAVSKRTTKEHLEQIASMWVEPVKQHVVIDFGTNETLDDALRGTSPLARIIWRDGPLQNQDRSTALMRLAHLCHTSSISPSMCHMIIIDADKRWGKYHLRGEAGQQEILKIVERAYGAR
jgi:hypothetical protein